MRQQLPQFIDVEDRIIGRLTAKQFAWILLGVGFCVPPYFIFTPIAFGIVAFVIMGVAAAFAFLKPYGRTFSAFVQSVLRYIMQPKLFLWNQEHKSIENEKVEVKINTPDFAHVVENKRKDLSDKRLNLLAQKLDSDIEFNPAAYEYDGQGQPNTMPLSDSPQDLPGMAPPPYQPSQNPGASLGDMSPQVNPVPSQPAVATQPNPSIGGLPPHVAVPTQNPQPAPQNFSQPAPAGNSGAFNPYEQPWA